MLGNIDHTNTTNLEYLQKNGDRNFPQQGNETQILKVPPTEKGGNGKKRPRRISALNKGETLYVKYV